MFIDVGETVTVTMQLSQYDFSVWNVVEQGWEIPQGTTGVAIGASSRDIRLQGSVTAG